MKKDENGFIIEPEELESEYTSAQFLMITYDVLSDSRLSEFQKLLYAAITGLCKGSAGYCWASNAYFEKLLKKSNTQVSEGISKLVNLGYIKREIVYKRKEDKDGNIVTTKQIAFRKLYIVLDPSLNRPIPENQNRCIPENQKEIYNPLIDNLTYKLSKDNLQDSPEESVKEKEELNIKNSNCLEEENDNCIDVSFSGKESLGIKERPQPAPHEPKEEKPKKGKGGVGPLIDIATLKYPVCMYPTLNAGLKKYLLAHIGIRRLPSKEKWQEMLDQLYEYSSIQVAGAQGSKFVESKALEIVKKAIEGKNGVPYLEFDNIYSNEGLMEPAAELNRDYNRGY